MLDFIFTETLGDIPWKKEDISWFKTVLKDLAPSGYRNCKVGSIYCRSIPVQELESVAGKFRDTSPEQMGRGRPEGRKSQAAGPGGRLTEIQQRPV